MDEGEGFPALAGDEEGAYEWFVQGSRLLEDGRSADAALLFSRVVLADPTSRSAWEGLARARFDAGDYERAEQAFNRLVELAPDDDYAHFGLGLALWRLRRFPEATLAARRKAGLPPEGQPGESLPSDRE